MPKFNKDKLGEFRKTIPETPFEKVSSEGRENKGTLPVVYVGGKDYGLDDKTEKEASVEDIAEILKNNKIDQIIIAGEKQKNKEEQTLRLHPDLDSELALYLLNNFNKRKPEEMYNDGAVVSVINKDGTGKELIEDKKGVKIYIDTGGNWLKIEKEGETTTLHIDHHGIGQRAPTSGVKMIAEIMDKAGILKEKPEWLNKLIDFVNDVDNLTYLDKKDKKGNKVFTESYFRNEWPGSLYALAEKKIPLKLLMELCEKGIIKDLTKPLTDEELNGEIGKIKVGEHTIKDICIEQRKEVSNTLDVGVKNSIKNNKEEGLDLENTRLGRVIYHNYFKIRGAANKILDHLAFKATIAKGYDTYVAYNNNKKKKSFFINSKNPNLSIVVEELNKKYPGCAIDIRGVMIYGKIVDGMTEEEFLNIIDPKILEGKNKVSKKEEQGDDKGADIPKDNEQSIVPEEKNTTYENQKENIEKRKEEAEKLHNNSVLTAGDNGFVVKESKYSYDIAKDLRTFIQKQATANQTGVIYKFKDGDNIYNYAISTYDAKRGAGIGYVGYSVKVDKDTLLTDEEIYEILENNLNASFDQKFPNKETWETDKDTHISSIEKNNFEKIKAKYEIKLAELDKKYNKNQEKNSEDNQDIKNEKEKQEKIDAIFEQFMKSISETKELEKRLAEIIEQENIAAEKKKEEENQNLHKKSNETKENKIEGSYTTIGYADVILDGKLKTKYISSAPREDTVFEILKDENGNIKLGIWKGAEKRALKNPDFLDGTEKMKINNKPTQINVELGDLQKDDEGGYRLIKKPVVKLIDESYKG